LVVRLPISGLGSTDLLSPSFKTPPRSPVKDVDYFGTKEAAQAFADAIGGELLLPTIDDMNTPNSAVVRATINGKELTVDFMHGVLGIKQSELRKGVSVIGVEADVEGKTVSAKIAVLHPVLCLKSRIANMLSPILMRRDRFAWAQLNAAMIVAQRHIDQALGSGDWNEAHQCLSAIFSYLRSDEFGKKADIELNVDALDILRAFQNDQRIDPRYRGFQLKQMITKIEKRRAGRRGAKPLTGDDVALATQSAKADDPFRGARTG
jgi:hypothetical protein